MTSHSYVDMFSDRTHLYLLHYIMISLIVYLNQQSLVKVTLYKWLKLMCILHMFLSKFNEQQD